MHYAQMTVSLYDEKISILALDEKIPLVFLTFMTYHYFLNLCIYLFIFS